MTARRKLPVHKLTDAGIRAAKDYMIALRDGRREAFPHSLLTDSQYAAPIEPRVHVEQRSFDSKRDAGLYLVRQLGPIGPARVFDNPRLWSWLGMFYFQSMVKKSADGAPILRGKNPSIPYIIDPNVTGMSSVEAYHHRLLLAYEIYVHHGERAWYMLDQPPISLNSFTLRLAGRRDAFRSEGVVDLAHRLYADHYTRKLKPRSLGLDRATAPPGSLPRLIDVLDQLYMTYDVYGRMTAEQILPLLPPEFDRFKPVAVD